MNSKKISKPKKQSVLNKPKPKPVSDSNPNRDKNTSDLNDNQNNESLYAEEVQACVDFIESVLLVTSKTTEKRYGDPNSIWLFGVEFTFTPYVITQIGEEVKFGNANALISLFATQTVNLNSTSFSAGFELLSHLGASISFGFSGVSANAYFSTEIYKLGITVNSYIINSIGVFAGYYDQKITEKERAGFDLTANGQLLVIIAFSVVLLGFPAVVMALA